MKQGPLHVNRNEFFISTDKHLLDLDVVFDFLHHHAYWSQGIPREVFERSVENALCFGIYHHRHQVGFARVISDFATFAYLGDVFVLPDYRGQGLSKWLMETIVGHPSLQGLRRFSLLTKDAHGLYAQSGFHPLSQPERHMEVVHPANEIYVKP